MDNTKTELNKSKIWRTVLWAVLETFAVVSLIISAINANVGKVLMCVFTMLLLPLLFAAAKLFHCEINPVFFVFCELYATGPMLGHVYNLYYHTSWWDDILHTSGGVVFAVFGVYFAKLINKKGEPSLFMKAVFALCFSMAVSVEWEFIEYGCDQIFGTDMQNDTVVSYVNSYLLGEELAQTGCIEGITEVIVNGQTLGINGYLDIGIHDTMHDMLVETLGAVVFVVIYLIDKERHPVIRSTKISKESELKKEEPEEGVTA